MQQLSNSNALEIQQNWEADSGVSTPSLSLSSQLDNQGEKQTFVQEIQFKSQELQQDIKILTAELSEEKGKSKNLVEQLSKTKQDLTKVQKLLKQFHVKKRNWTNFYKTWKMTIILDLISKYSTYNAWKRNVIVYKNQIDIIEAWLSTTRYPNKNPRSSIRSWI